MSIDTFRARVNRAHRMMINGEDGRALDNCFEMYDGACVAAVLYRAALDGDEALRAAIDRDFALIGGFDACSWKQRATEREGWSMARIEIEAAQLRAEGEASSRRLVARQGQQLPAGGLFDADAMAQGDIFDKAEA